MCAKPVFRSFSSSLRVDFSLEKTPYLNAIQARPLFSWLHGDLKDVAYTYVFRLFDTWVEIGQLK